MSEFLLGFIQYFVLLYLAVKLGGGGVSQFQDRRYKLTEKCDFCQAPVKRRATGCFDYDETLSTTKAIKR